MFGPYQDVSLLIILIVVNSSRPPQVSRLFSMIDGSRLVDFSKYSVMQMRFSLRLHAGGQWALPCNTADTLSFTFKCVYLILFYGF